MLIAMMVLWGRRLLVRFNLIHGGYLICWEMFINGHLRAQVLDIKILFLLRRYSQVRIVLKR
ncbi:hypothetical protein EOS_02435 [Caballeronia mineralivorans PML1(12)]|uniref:Uncharacterized protein n=1 Tax=Caballeronia mineralivorans PML1(12) TaxID=908627 RepID=A0A0J1D551_9BURK|nr:hypothetical protein EOS_02435 [Caballeronia mineralivorans PML1(12)]